MTHISRASQIFTFPNVSAHESKNHEHFITTGSVFRATLPTIDSIPGQERERQLELTEAPPDITRVAFVPLPWLVVSVLD